MKQNKSSIFFLMFLVVVAIFGVVLALILMLQVTLPVDSLSFRRPFIGALYSVVCVLGIVAVFYPSKCRLMFQKPKESSSFDNAYSSSVQLSGHHPDCKNFSANRIIIRGRAFCAACCGLLIGAIASMIGILLLSLGLYNVEAGNIWFFAVGAVLMLVGLAQIKLGGYIKVAANALFVIGSGISLIVADLVGQNFLLDAYVLGLIIYMLWLRILLSEWNNRRICMNCQLCS